jgi:TolB-like protein
MGKSVPGGGGEDAVATEGVRFRFAGFVLDADRLELRKGAERIDVQPKVLHLLRYLLENAGRTVTKEELLDALWPDTTVGEGSLTSVVGRTRRALGEGNDQIVRTVHRLGYRIGVPVTPERESPEAGGIAPEGEIPSTRAAAAQMLDRYALGEPTSQPALPDRPSLVVLPFDDLSPDPGQNYFADGITEELIGALCKVSALFVISRNTAFTYQNRSVRAEDLGVELGVRYVLEGSVRRAGTRVRVTAQLIEAASDHHIWGDQYDRDLGDIFSVQSEIAEEILRALSIQIREAELRRLRRTPTRELGAYEAYLKGRSLFHKQTRSDNDAARQLFERAIELDPGFADAIGALGITILVRYGWLWERDPKLLERAEQLARRAISIDPLAAIGHLLLGAVLFERENVKGARLSAEAAIRLTPGEVDAHQLLAWIELWSGEPLAGLARLERVVRLDPRPVPAILETLGTLNFQAGRGEEAVQYWEGARAAAPDFIPARLMLVLYYDMQGKHDLARLIGREVLGANPAFTIREAEIHARTFLPDDQSRQRWLEALRRAGIPR